MPKRSYNFITDDGVSGTVSDDNIHINDSYKIRKRSDMKSLLSYISASNRDNEVFKHRPMYGLICEWRSHNLLFDLGYKRERTSSVDLNYPQRWYVRVAYFGLSKFYMPWIKK